MDSFEDGCMVALRVHNSAMGTRNPFRYAALSENQGNDHTSDIFLNTSDHCKDIFKLSKYADGTISLQNSAGWYLSPDGDQWTFRGWCDRWEHLHVEPTAYKAGGSLVQMVSICAVQHSRFDSTAGRRHSTDDPIPLYVGVAADVLHNCIATTEPVTEWEIVLADIPVINMLGVDKLEIRTTPTDSLSTLSRESSSFIRKVLRAMLEIGSFHLTGHGGNTDFYSVVHKSVGLLPWRDLDEDEPSENQFQEKYDILKFRDGKIEFCRYTREYLKTYLQAANDYFNFAETLCDFLLHAMALGAAEAHGAVDWRWVWCDNHRVMNLRLSTYYPGPVQMGDGKTDVMMASRQTDESWLTLVQTNYCEGMEVKSTLLGRWLPVASAVPGSLFVLAGDVLEAATKLQISGKTSTGARPLSQGSLYRPTGYRVKRIPHASKYDYRRSTFLNMPFSYSRELTSSAEPEKGFQLLEARDIDAV